MTWLALEIGDAATWGSTAVTFCMACFAIAQGFAQRRDMRQQNELQAEASQLQRRQIETAERRTLVMEQLLMQLSAAPQQAGAVPRSAPDPAPAGGGAAAEEPEWEDSASRPGSGDRYPAAEEPEWQDAAPRPAPADWYRAVPAAAAPPAGYGESPPPQQQPAPAGPYNGAAPRGGHPAPAGDPGPSPWGAPLQAVAAPPPSPAEWRLERVGRHGFALRNTTSRTLEGVRVDGTNLPGSARGVPENAVVRAGETAEFLMAPERGRPLPEYVQVTWEGRPGPVRVPVPRG